MKSKINEKNNHVTINISQVDNDQDAILQNLNACKEGNCSCPTDEYEKLKNLDIRIDTEFNEIIVELEPKKDEKFAINEIQKCLDHTASKIANKDKD